MDSDVMVCYHCNQPIANNMEVVSKVKIFENRKIVYRDRVFHLDCLTDYRRTMSDKNDRKIENDDWHKVGNLFKEILGIPVYRDNDKHAVLRLLGLRVGRFIPNGQNVRGLKKGYPFDVIYNTMIYSRPAMERALNEVEFRDQRHKINYLMSILISNLNFIEERMKRIEKVDSTFSEFDFDKTLNTETADYHNKVVESEVSNILKEESIEEEDNLKEYEDLFK